MSHVHPYPIPPDSLDGRIAHAQATADSACAEAAALRARLEAWESNEEADAIEEDDDENARPIREMAGPLWPLAKFVATAIVFYLLARSC